MSSNKKHPQEVSRPRADRSDDEYSEYSTTSSSNNDSEYLSHIKFDGEISFCLVGFLNR